MAEIDNGNSIRSGNRWGTRQLVIMALLCALAILLSFIEFPVFPAVPYLKYDASFVPVMVGGFAFGAGPGVAIGVVAAAAHGLLLGDLAGTMVNIMVTVGYVLPAALIYRRLLSRKGMAFGLVAGSVCSIVFAILANILITPFYIGAPVESVLAIVVPILLPFNILKATINSVLSFIVFLSISSIVEPKKGQKSQ